MNDTSPASCPSSPPLVYGCQKTSDWSTVCTPSCSSPLEVVERHTGSCCYSSWRQQGWQVGGDRSLRVPGSQCLAHNLLPQQRASPRKLSVALMCVDGRFEDCLRSCCMYSEQTRLLNGMALLLPGPPTKVADHPRIEGEPADVCSCWPLNSSVSGS